MVRLSLVNLIATATLTPSSASTAYPVTNLRSWADLDLPYRTAALGEQTVLVDHGSAATVDGWALLATNFTSFRMQANATNAWATPSYDSGLLTIETNIGNGRRCHLLRPGTAQTYQYNRLVIPSQSTTDSVGYYRIGAMWTGTLTAPPRDVRLGLKLGQVEAARDVHTVSMRRQRSIMGPSLCHVTGQRQCVGITDTVSEELKDWFALERAWKAADVALVSFVDTDPAWCCVMRSLKPIEWTRDLPAESEIDWEEVA